MDLAVKPARLHACDIDEKYASQKRKKNWKYLKQESGPRHRTTLSTKRSRAHVLISLLQRRKTKEIISYEGLPEKNAGISGHSAEEYAWDNFNLSAETMPVTAEMKRRLGATPPTNPYLGFPTLLALEKLDEKVPNYETNSHINSPYLWSVQRAGHFINEPIFQLVDGKFYRHPSLPPGWTISVSQSRSMSYYHHSDLGSTCILLWRCRRRMETLLVGEYLYRHVPMRIWFPGVDSWASLWKRTRTSPLLAGNIPQDRYVPI